jgi:hypothetical protein
LANNSFLLWIWACKSFTDCLAVALLCSRAGWEDRFFKACFTAAKWLSSWETGSREALISVGRSWSINSSASLRYPFAARRGFPSALLDFLLIELS